MDNLSYKWVRYYFKNVAVIASFLSGLFTIVFIIIIVYQSANINLKIILGLSLCIGNIYYSFAYSYFLLKSKTLMFDEEYIYVGHKSIELTKIPLSKIIKAKRTLRYFYTIYLRDNDYIKKIYVFISFNPPIRRTKSFTQLLKFINDGKTT